ncbi:EamA family transporter [Euzebya tangerina]|uniref:EamA family transporter n=1 Tax=Euzebya tangerina TaxID=591198 RepID=UPI000E316DBD|nr:EamA family transporter [Euzebya tangerina]
MRTLLHRSGSAVASRITTSLATLPVQTVGRGLVLIAFVTGGLGSVLAKVTFDLGATPLSFLFVRLVAAVAVLRLLTGRDMWAIPLHRQARLVGLGVLFGCQSLSYFSAVAISPVALVVVTVASYPVALLVMDAVAVRTMPSPGRLAALVVCLGGLWLAAGSPAATLDPGLLLALASSVGYAVYLRVSASTLAARHPGKRNTHVCDLAIPPMVATLWVLVGALGLVTAAMLITTSALPSLAGAGLSVVHGLVSTTLPLVAIYAALSRLRAEDVAGLGPLEPIVASGVAVLALGETLTPSQVAGIAVVITAVAYMAGAIRLGKAVGPMRPRVGLPRLPFVVDKVVRPERRRPAATAGRVEIARLWGQAQS